VYCFFVLFVFACLGTHIAHIDATYGSLFTMQAHKRLIPKLKH